jgi:hypothetical protein
VLGAVRLRSRAKSPAILLNREAAFGRPLVRQGTEHSI